MPPTKPEKLFERTHERGREREGAITKRVDYLETSACDDLGLKNMINFQK